MTAFNKQDYINYRIQKAKETFSEVDVLINNEFWKSNLKALLHTCPKCIGGFLPAEIFSALQSFAY